MNTRSSTRGRCQLTVLMAALVSVSLVGCDQSSQRQLELPESNRSMWVMPTDSYMMSLEVDEAVTYALLLIDAECMTQAGYPLSVPFKDVAKSWRSDTWNGVGLRLFDTEVAATYGYHLAPSRIANREEWAQFNQQELSDSARAQLDSCRQHRRTALADPSGASNDLAALVATADESALRSPDVVEAAARWRECMAPLGIVDLGDSPLSTPTQSQNENFGMIDGSLTAQPTMEEVSEAVFDAGCEESSGFADAYYRVAWDENLEMLRTNLDAFERARTTFSEAQATALALIAEHAPSN